MRNCGGICLTNVVTNRQMRVEPKAPVMFTGGRQEFQCEIGLFRKLPGTSKLQQIHSGVAVELGEEVQLKSVVRSNDGWFHSKMTDVTVRRLKQSANSVSDGSATLVLSDGCRNPAYKVRTSAPKYLTFICLAK